MAAVARASAIRSVGIDVEPPLPLPEDLLDMIATANERRELKGDLVSARLLFCMKEAVYKATHPIDGVFLEHHDVEVRLTDSVALTKFRTQSLDPYDGAPEADCSGAVNISRLNSRAPSWAGAWGPKGVARPMSAAPRPTGKRSRMLQQFWGLHWGMRIINRATRSRARA